MEEYTVPPLFSFPVTELNTSHQLHTWSDSFNKLINFFNAIASNNSVKASANELNTLSQWLAASHDKLKNNLDPDAVNLFIKIQLAQFLTFIASNNFKNAKQVLSNFRSYLKDKCTTEERWWYYAYSAKLLAELDAKEIPKDTLGVIYQQCASHIQSQMHKIAVENNMRASVPKPAFSQITEHQLNQILRLLPYDDLKNFTFTSKTMRFLCVNNLSKLGSGPYVLELWKKAQAKYKIIVDGYSEKYKNKELLMPIAENIGKELQNRVKSDFDGLIFLETIKPKDKNLVSRITNVITNLIKRMKLEFSLKPIEQKLYYVNQLVKTLSVLSVDQFTLAKQSLSFVESLISKLNSEKAGLTDNQKTILDTITTELNVMKKHMQEKQQNQTANTIDNDFGAFF